MCKSTIAIQKQAGIQIVQAISKGSGKTLNDRWQKKKHGYFQKCTTNAEKVLKLELPEVRSYCDTSKIIVWENNGQHALENSIFQAVTYVAKVERNIRNNLRPQDESLESLRVLLIDAMKYKTKIKEANIMNVLNGLTSVLIENYERNLSIQMVSFLKKCIYPIINTSCSVDVVIQTPCQGCGLSIQTLISHEMFVIQSENVSGTTELMEQLLFSTNLMQPCPNCTEHELARPVEFTIIMTQTRNVKSEMIEDIAGRIHRELAYFRMYGPYVSESILGKLKKQISLLHKNGKLILI
ncbi:unnamed protein product, partial [Didymodactylos carnosus]